MMSVGGLLSVVDGHQASSSVPGVVPSTCLSTSSYGERERERESNYVDPLRRFPQRY